MSAYISNDGELCGWNNGKLYLPYLNIDGYRCIPTDCNAIVLLEKDDKIYYIHQYNKFQLTYACDIDGLINVTGTMTKIFLTFSEKIIEIDSFSKFTNVIFESYEQNDNTSLSLKNIYGNVIYTLYLSNFEIRDRKNKHITRINIKKLTNDIYYINIINNEKYIVDTNEKRSYLVGDDVEMFTGLNFVEWIYDFSLFHFCDGKILTFLGPIPKDFDYNRNNITCSRNTKSARKI